MPAVNWHIFESLPGSATRNFEYLCRALVRLHFGRYGHFAALANQPGVEFHLRLTEKCPLGAKGRWFGWQCRWYELAPGKAIGTTRRRKIVESLTKSQSEIPGLTDWVLWTRHPLTRGDQEWFKSLRKRIRLHQWTSAEIEMYLTGDATTLRATYFGELVITPDMLEALHERSVARIRPRWLRGAHQTVDAERTIRRMLVERDAWGGLDLALENIKRFDRALTIGKGHPKMPHAATVHELRRSASFTCKVLGDVSRAVDEGDHETLQQLLASRPRPDKRQLLRGLGRLRAADTSLSLFATNLIGYVRAGARLLTEMAEFFDVRTVAVLAGAGGGKTQLAAELTAAKDDRCAGVLLHGQELGARDTLDDLARTVVVNGAAVASAEALAAGVDAAGRRGRRRLPIVIDGLNEAEDPRRWKKLLAEFDEILRRYPNVLLVCTVRSEDFAKEALPEFVRRLEIRDFGEDAMEAINKYFAYFKINPADADLPLELLRNPLTLRLFCEVTNPKRERVVGVEAMPGSLTALFDSFIANAAERIADLSSKDCRYYELEIATALNQLGQALWEANARTIDETEFRRRIGDDQRSWDKSVVRALQQEGLIIRVSGERSSGGPFPRLDLPSPHDETTRLHAPIRIEAVYDAFGGHIIADAFVVSTGANGIAGFLASGEVVQKIGGGYDVCHPIRDDIVRALAGLLPRRLHGQQLWSCVSGSLRARAVIEAAKLEAAYIDAPTVTEVRSLIAAGGENASRVFGRLLYIRAAVGHPLNSEFLDSVLQSMSMADRDMNWTMWVLHARDELEADIDGIQLQWRQQEKRSPASRLRAVWISWLLTSTVRSLRDKATRALYWFGRGAPTDLFELTLSALKINDPYVPERMLAAAYGVAMALHRRSTDERFRSEILPAFALELFKQMFADGAPHWTTHALARDYASHTIQLALLHHPRLVSRQKKRRVYPPFHGSSTIAWGRAAAEYHGGYHGPIHMDFGNYTIGGLVPDRANYDYKNAEYQAVVQAVLWRIYNLGYDDRRFEAVDRNIGSGALRYGRLEGNKKIDRYGKKYSWIAFFEMAGQRASEGKLREWYGNHNRLPDIDIDPSFPDPPPSVSLVPRELEANEGKLSIWLKRQDLPQIERLLIREELVGAAGKWVLLGGYFHQRDPDRNIGISCHVHTVLCATAVYRQLQQQFRSRHKLIDNHLRTLSIHYTFVGEAPWADTFPACGEMEIGFIVGKRFVKHRRQALDDLFSRPVTQVEDGKGKPSAYTVSEVPVRRDFRVLLPTVENNWESYHTATNPGGLPALVGRELCEALGLYVDQQTSEFYDQNGAKASVVVKADPPKCAAQEFVYLRKDLFDAFLRTTGKRAAWFVSGQRELHTRNVEDLRALYDKHGPSSGFEGAISYPSLSRL